MTRTWNLTGPDGRPYASDRPGQYGGHRRTRIYGRLDCPAALRAIARGGYVTHRVFFADERTARAAGYRPCAVCLPEQYASLQRARSRAVGAHEFVPGGEEVRIDGSAEPSGA